jgi:hypothetical protein
MLPSIGYSQFTDNSTGKGGQEVKLVTPILQRISDKGTYLVAIKSGQSPISTGLNIEIVFLNKNFSISKHSPHQILNQTFPVPNIIKVVEW